VDHTTGATGGSGARGQTAAAEQRLSGVFVPVVTPFERGELRLDALRENLRKLSATEVKGYLALGSNGEARSLDDEEERRVLEVFAEEMREKVVMVGTGSESLRNTLRKTLRAAEMGFPFASVLTPGYFAKMMKDETLVAYFNEVADRSPIPILIYNAPGFAAGVSLSAAAVSRLADHRNIVGIKDSAPTGPGAFLTALSPEQRFSVLAGSTNFFYPSMVLGAVGGVLSSANYLPEACCRLRRLAVEGNHAAALQLHHRLVRINRAVSSRFGVAGVKAAMDCRGFKGGEPRSPLRPLDADQRASLCALLEAAGL